MHRLGTQPGSIGRGWSDGRFVDATDIGRVLNPLWWSKDLLLMPWADTGFLDVTSHGKPSCTAIAQRIYNHAEGGHRLPPAGIIEVIARKRLRPIGQDLYRRQIGRTKGGMNTKLHAVTDAKGRPIKFFMTAGQVSDYIGAAALLSSLPAADWLLADRGYDADWYREALQDKGIKPCIPGQKSRGTPVKHDKRRYKRRNRIEIMFGRLKDWRRVATRYDRCPWVFLSAVALAATIIFWL